MVVGRYDVGGDFSLDLSEIKDLSENIKKALGSGIKSSDISRRIDPAYILLNRGGFMGITILMRHTPIGDDFSNWGYWDYGDYVLYGGDHAKGTLRRGWATKDPSEAENNLALPIDSRSVKLYIKREIKVHRIQNTHYYIDLPNCVPYANDVEYGHKVVFPGEAHRHYFEMGGASARFTSIKNGSVGATRFVPGQFFVKKAISKSNWQPVMGAMHAEYVKRFRMVFK